MKIRCLKSFQGEDPNRPSGKVDYVEGEIYELNHRYAQVLIRRGVATDVVKVPTKRKPAHSDKSVKPPEDKSDGAATSQPADD